MSFELQYNVSIVICVLLFAIFWCWVIWQRVASLDPVSITANQELCEYCHLESVTTCYEENMRQDVLVCSTHSQMFVID